MSMVVLSVNRLTEGNFINSGNKRKNRMLFRALRALRSKEYIRIVFKVFAGDIGQ